MNGTLITTVEICGCVWMLPCRLWNTPLLSDVVKVSCTLTETFSYTLPVSLPTLALFWAHGICLYSLRIYAGQSSVLGPATQRERRMTTK